MILLFGCILLHELGHGLQAHAFGLAVRRITLLPIGGLAQLESPPAYPLHELTIALAGPLVNLGLALILITATYLLQPFTISNWIDQAILIFFSPPTVTGLLLYLFGANLILFVFNMIPAFPMDGGRVLRSGLALIVDYELATRIAAWIGRVLAVLMSGIGLIGWPPAHIPPNPLMLVLGVMVFFGARQEEFYVRRQRALIRLEVSDLTRPSAEIIAPWDALTGSLVARLFQHDHTLPVLVEGRLVGLLTYQDVRRAYNSGIDPSSTVAHVMRTTFPNLKLSDTLWVALQEMNSFQLAVLPVLENGLFQGVISLDDINRAWQFAGRHRGPVKAMPLSGDIAHQ
jgi:Zn-dependent protease